MQREFWPRGGTYEAGDSNFRAGVIQEGTALLDNLH